MNARKAAGLLFTGLGLVLMIVGIFLILTADAKAQSFEDALNALDTKSFADKADAVQALAQLDDERVVPVLTAMGEGRLFRRKDDDQFVIGEKRGRAYDLTAVLTGEPLGEARSRELNKIKVNNKLRGTIKAVLGRLELGSSDRSKRLAAVENILRDRSPEAAEQLRAALDEETDPEVRDAMAFGLAAMDLESDDSATQLAAIELLSDSFDPKARAMLGQVARTSDDEEVREAAQAAIESIERQRWLLDLA
ncbi:MAG: HEAT repeat domain-containing protein, partial [Pseudomonadota bacterium]